MILKYNQLLKYNQVSWFIKYKKNTFINYELEIKKILKLNYLTLYFLYFNKKKNIKLNINYFLYLKNIYLLLNKLKQENINILFIDELNFNFIIYILKKKINKKWLESLNLYFYNKNIKILLINNYNLYMYIKNSYKNKDMLIIFYPLNITILNNLIK